MQAIQSNQLVRLQKVTTFFASRTISTPPTGLADQMTALTNAITATQAAATTQADATDYLARQTTTVRQLRRTLHDEQLLPLYHSAVALKKDVPGILDHFKIPGTTLREAAYVTQLTVIASRAAEFQTQFIAHGASVDFVATLNTAITNYRSMVTARQQAMQTRTAARKTLALSLTAGSQAVQHLNAIVRRVYAKDPATMAAWTQATHLDRVASHQSSASAGPASGSSAGTTAGGATVAAPGSSGSGASTGTAGIPAVPAAHAA